jgi:hypothetical protein
VTEQPEPTYAEQMAAASQRVGAAFNELVQAFGELFATMAEGLAPTIRAMAELANDPAVRSEIQRRRSQGSGFCLCFCSIAHPDRDCREGRATQQLAPLPRDPQAPHQSDEQSC